jgi:AcrR family transcriptional regulator
MKTDFEQAVVAAASEEFATRGFDDVSLRRLAKKMGCAVGTLYLYFDNKEELLHAVVESSFQILADRMAALPVIDDPVEMLRSCFRAYVEFGLDFPNHYRCAFALSQRSASGRYRPHRAFEFLQAQVRIGVEKGVFRSRENDAIAQVIWASVHGLTSLLITRPNFPWADREVLVRLLTDTMIAGLSAAPQRGKVVKQPRGKSLL